ncbi:MAG TPA: [LysW]-aminoadipate kinase [Streptosporangiaceae bacterium]|nr:[LysW]-aminoadipate kinase [Streptosporangiaceae bacterium]
MLTVVKCSGARDIDAGRVAADLAQFVARGNELVLVVGGAPDIEQLGGRLGGAARTLVTTGGETRRYTDAAGIEVLAMAMAGLVQPRWLTALAGHGVPAVGLTGLDGSCVTARRTPARRALAGGRKIVIRDDRSGRVSGVNGDLLRALLAAGYVPVMAPPAVAEDGGPVNVNADRLAAAVASAMSASALVMLTAVPGVLRDPADSTTLIGRLPLAAREPLPGWVRDGMALKLVAAGEALDGGVRTVVIADGRGSDPVARALAGGGTRVMRPRAQAGPPARPAVRTAEVAVIDLLQDMIAIPSPSGSERELAGFLADAMTESGIQAGIDEAGNVIGRTGRGSGPTVLLAGHMDTLPGPASLRREGGLLFGRGASDAKGPLAAFIAAAAAWHDFPGTLIVAGLVEEETPQSRGATHLARTLPQPDAVIVGEPGRWQNVIIGYKGKLDLTYRVSRPATHPTNPAEKAAEAAMEFWREAAAAPGQELDHAKFGLPALTLTEMSGDISAAMLRLSYRTPPGFDHDGLVTRLRKAAGEGQIEVENAVPAVRTSRSNQVVGALLAAIRDTGGTPRTVLKTATSDMNTLAQTWSCPMATYGPGDNRLGHTMTEHIEIDDLLASVRALRTALGHLGMTGRQTS